MELALLIFRGSLDFNVEMNRLRTTVKKMQRDSTINRNSGLSVLVSGIPLFASYCSEFQEVIGFIANDININRLKSNLTAFTSQIRPFSSSPTFCITTTANEKSKRSG